MAENLKYDENSIAALSGLEPIRTTPTMFIGSLDNAGQVHTAKELVDNAYDELNNQQGGTLFICIFRDFGRETYQLLIGDTGRGFPLGSFEKCLTELHVSGKFNQSAYDFSGGTYGVGSKCQAALSVKSKAITLRPEGAAILTLHDGQKVDIQYVDNPTPEHTGTWIMYEPAKTWESHGNTYVMHDVDRFATSGFIELVKILRVNDIFSEGIRTVVATVDVPIPDKVWDINTPLPDILKTLRNIDEIYTPTYVYDTNAVEDRNKYLFDYLGLDRRVIWGADNIELDKTQTTNDRLSFKCKLYVTKSLKPASLVVVNSIIMRYPTNSPQRTLQKVINGIVLEKIVDPVLKKFWAEINYNVPIQAAVYVRYGGAKFSGTIKDTYEDKEFEVLFAENLLIAMNRLVSEEHLMELVTSVVVPDLELKYQMYHNKGVVSKGNQKLLLDLNNSKNFTACLSKVASECELFIVEGTSASHIKKAVDNRYQAVLETRGKPLNAIASHNDRRVALARLKKNPIYADMLMVLGIVPGSDDLSKCNYGKIIIATDADPDGEHIATLHTANLALMCPKILEMGMLYIATPPMYKMKIRDNYVYFRDRVALTDARINYIYSSVFKFYVASDVFENGCMELTGDAYRDFCYMVQMIGDKTEHISNILNIPVLVLERIVYGIEHIFPTVNVEALVDLFSIADGVYTGVVYDQTTESLIVSIDEKDIPISLTNLTQVIRDELLPIYTKSGWKHYNILLSTILTHTFNKTPVSLMQVYKAMQEINSMAAFRVDRFKGLGEMDVADMQPTITNPHHRTLWRISSVRDIEQVFALMGKDADVRKAMMSNRGNIADELMHT